MRRGLLFRFVLLALAAAASPLRAHVGSPNVFYDGDAGPYPLRVIVRPPIVVPGLAEITVRLKQGRADEVTVQPIQWRAGPKGAPPPDAAAPVPGTSDLWSAQLWLMESSSYSVRVQVKGPAGEGTALVPVTAMPMEVLRMKKGMGIILAGLGLFLFAGAVTLVGAAVRESVLVPGEAPTPRRRTGARAVSVLAALFFACVLWGGKSWWDSVDARAQARIFKPFAVKTAAHMEGGRAVLAMKIDDGRSKDWTPLMPDHGKLMHMFLVREPALDAFAHVHPVPKGKEEFRAALPPLPPGSYRVYADVVHESGFPQTLVDMVRIPVAPGAESAAGLQPDPDDSWRAAVPDSPTGAGPRQSVLDDGSIMLWHQVPLTVDQETDLRFEVRTAGGAPVPLEPYMGMQGHAAVTRGDGEVFVHLHPMGSINMAAQQSFARKDAEAGLAPATAAIAGTDHSMHARHGEAASSVVSFPYAFPQAGRHRIWVQVKSAGKVLTGVFDAEVKEAGPAV
jgi:hypothetical protein